MTHVIRNLPRQPIPPLADTLNACVRSVSPSLNSLQRLKSKLVFELYGAAQAKQQQRLLEMARRHPTIWCAAGRARRGRGGRGGRPDTDGGGGRREDGPHARALT